MCEDQDSYRRTHTSECSRKVTQERPNYKSDLNLVKQLIKSSIKGMYVVINNLSFICIMILIQLSTKGYEARYHTLI
jgi:lipopolysaccharide/colanic/teichoic acid biosynthesis glycosyltransferase